MEGVVTTGEAVQYSRTFFTGIWLKPKLYLLEDYEGSVAAYKGCSTYPEGTPFDATWKAASAFAIIAVVIGMISCFVTYFASCTAFSDGVWKSFALLMIFNSLFQGLTLLFLASNACTANRESFNWRNISVELQPGCQLGSGANLAIAATVLWLLAGLLMLKTPNPSYNSNEGSVIKVESEKRADTGDNVEDEQVARNEEEP